MRLIPADWPAPEEVMALATTRIGGVSRGPFESLNFGDHVGDDGDAVRANRAQLVKHLTLRAEPRWLTQVHGARVVRAGSPEFAEGPPVADAIVCHKGREALAIMTADCVPVMLCDLNARGLAAIHCGWRSLAAGIIGRTVQMLGGDPAGFMAWLGPGISQSAFEVGDDVRDIFLADVEDAAACFEPNENDRWQADLEGLVKLYLARAGVGRIYASSLCTYSDPELFFSYRRDGQCGRMVSLIYRKTA